MGSNQNNIAENHVDYFVNPLDVEEFRKQGYMLVDFLTDYYLNVEKYPVRSQVEPGYLSKCLPESAPYNPEPINKILQDVKDHIIPGLTNWQSPNHFAHFPASSSTAGFLGEMLSTGFNVVSFNWMSSPAATELESIVMDWFGEMLMLPKSFLFSGNGGGVMQNTTCEAILCTLIASRDQMLSRIGIHNMEKLVVYGSDQTHSSLQKAVKIVGINLKNFRTIETTKTTFFALSPDSLESAIRSDIEAGLIPLFLCATIGTTSTTAVDPLGPLCDVAKAYGIWVHVDAAFAGSACICAELRHFLDGIEGANSFSLNTHKWFFTNLECCCLWVKDPSALTKSLSTEPEFLRNSATESKNVIDYKDWQITLTRKFRALKLWFVIRSYGVSNLKIFLRNHVRMAKLFEKLVSMDERFEVVVPTNFSMVCFGVSPSEIMKKTCNYKNDTLQGHTNKVTCQLLESLNASGLVYMTHAVVGGTYVIRFAIGATLTEDRHIIMAWKVIQDHANLILNSYGS